MTTKSVKRRLNEIRKCLNQTEIPKKGKGFHGNKYHRLEDIEPLIVQYSSEYDIFPYFQFKNDETVLIIEDVDSDEHITFVLRNVEVEKIGNDVVKGLGGYTTYIRRYLYCIAFCIAEDCIIEQEDKTKEVKKSVKPKTVKPKLKPTIKKDKQKPTPTKVLEAEKLLKNSGIVLNTATMTNAFSSLSLSSAEEKEGIAYIKENY